MGLFNLLKGKNIAETKPTASAPLSTAPLKPQPQPEQPKEKPVRNYETVKGTGMQYHIDNIMSFARDNAEYDYSKNELLDNGIDRAYEYDFKVKEFTFEEEPDNPYDKNAVKILADGKLVAYVKKGSCSHIKNLIKADNIKSITGEIYGGKYKEIYDDSEDYEHEKYVIEKGELPYCVVLTVYYKEQK